MSMKARHRLEESRKELLDLGLRNPLINHRQRAKQVKVVDELSTEVYRILLVEGRKMSFDALPEKKAEEPAGEENNEETDEATMPWKDLLAQPDEELEDGQLAPRHTDHRLQTTMVSKKLQTKLLSIHNDARTHLEERGVNVLFLALGFLHWYEAPSAKKVRRAPLVLIPVEIKRANVQGRFRVAYTGEDLGDNLSLMEKLKADFSIELPKIKDAEELKIEDYFSSVEDAIKDDERWYVDHDEMTLGFFLFGKFLMYKDLDPKAWPEHAMGNGFSILDSLLTDGFSKVDNMFGDETRIDEVVSPGDMCQVMDADSTQILAILDVNDGRNLVLQGPPGTGKSQTITNIIAECIGKGKKTLFVSEKMAAMDVVKRRLDDVGLGDAVLELHSQKTNKKLVLAELDRTLNHGCPAVDNPTEDIENLTVLRDELNAYCDAVNKPIANSRINFVNALGSALRNHPGDLDVQPFDFEPMSEWSNADYRAVRRQVETLDRHLAEAGPLSKNPFRFSGLDEFIPSQRPKLEKALKEAKEDTVALLTDAVELAQTMGLQVPDTRDTASIICRAARRAMEAPHIEGLALTSGEWQARRDDLFCLVAAGKKLSTAHALYDDWLIDDAWQLDLVKERQSYVTKGHKWWRFLSGDFRRAKARLQGLCRKSLQRDVNETIKMIDTILDSQKQRKQYQELSDLGASLFGAQWKKVDSDWEVLEKLTEWVVTLYRDVGNSVAPEGIVNFLSGSPKVDELREKLQGVEDRLKKHEQSIRRVADLLELKLSDKTKIHWDVTLEKQSNMLGCWRKTLDSLFHLIRFNQLADELTGRALDSIVTAAKDWSHAKGTLLQLFDYSWFNGLLEKAYAETPSINRFDLTEHIQLRGEFSCLDGERFLRHNCACLAELHWKSLPKLSDGGELQIIKREINKKRRLMPIRRLMSEAGNAIQAIKPVFMMSPMSIATYIPPVSVQFDLVVFDEASQVKPVDAFGAILRANQVVVVGDSKQLPPSNFFDSMMKHGDEDDYENVSDIESIMSMFLGKGIHERMLRWHYRSRHHSLIAVSNNEFYDNRLIVFPSPGINTGVRGLKLHHLPDTVYDRGKTRSNPKEAEAVAREVLKHAKAYPDLTLGVVAFSTAQRDAIELQLDRLRRADTACEPFFTELHEPFFIKNLENVQGDERDVIFISIGYGKTADGYMTMSFGPLNKDGGERRLNVLITRARRAMNVFSNFKSDDIDLKRAKGRGVVALKNFLAYADTGVLDQPYSTGKETDSPFEDEVIKALTQNGIEVEPQVGTAGFFIDIGVKDQEKPGRYILGIECDGATYHSALSARDRDRLRQEVLERLGWRLHRIWSTEWYRNQEREIERALAAIQKAGHDFRNGAEGEAPRVAPKKNNTSITRKKVTQPDDITHNKSVPYKRADLDIPYELLELSEERLFEFVYQVLKLESPIHKTELIHRITEGSGLGRSGRLIRNAVQSAVNYGLKDGKIQQKGDFLWLLDMVNPDVRDRSELDASSKKLEFVSPEEISVAIQQVVDRAFSISEDDAVSNAAHALGFKRMTSKAKERFVAQLARMLKDGTLVSHNGRLIVAKGL